MHNNYNPYQITTTPTDNPVKTFFKKPITLVLAALFIAGAILPAVCYLKLNEHLDSFSRVADYLAASLGGMFFAPANMEELFKSGTIIIMITSMLAPLLIAVALIILFIASKNTSPTITGKAGCSVFVSGASVSSFGMTYTACMILFPLIDLFDRMGDAKLTDELTSHVVRLIVTLSTLMIYSLSFGIFTRSVFKNLGRAKKAGRFAACFFGVSSILVAAVYMLFTIDISDSTGNPMSDEGKLLLSVFALSAVTYIVTAVFAFMYSAHIKNQPSQPLTPYAQPTTPAQPTVTQISQTAPIPSVPTPQPVVARTSVRQTEDKTPTDIPAFCPECGNPVAEHQLFCAECGTKLN